MILDSGLLFWATLYTIAHIRANAVLVANDLRE